MAHSRWVLPLPGLPEGIALLTDVLTALEERSFQQHLDLLTQAKGQAGEVEGIEGLLQGQLGLAKQSLDAIVVSRLAFLGRQIRQELRMRPALSCRLFGNHRILLPEGRQA